jgi:hypothetical protein
MFSQLAQQNEELRVLPLLEHEIDRSVDRLPTFGTASVTGESMTDSYLQC